jgi:phenylalanyl-tRNA synthetase beta chain
LSLLDDLGAPTGSLQTLQGSNSPWWHPGRSARIQLGPKAVIAEFGQVHPATLKAMDVDAPLYGFEVTVDALPDARRKAGKARGALDLSPLMPLRRDFAFVVDRDRPADQLVRAAKGADKALIADARVFDVYEGKGVPDGKRSIALEVLVQPRDKTLTDTEIEALSARVVSAVEKATGGVLRG